MNVSWLRIDSKANLQEYMKRCTKCDVKKEEHEFYKSKSNKDGLHNICKYCWKLRRSKNYFEKRDEFRKKHREYYLEHSEEIKKNAAKQFRSPEVAKKFRRENPEKYRAHYAVNNGLKRGLLQKASECEICGDKRRLHAHHEDYTKPLEVLWVCPQCHSNIHKKLS